MFNNIFQNKKVLVTGNTGFKGSWLTLWLLKLGANIIGVSKNIPTNPSFFQVLNLQKNIEHHFLDIKDIKKLKKVIFSSQPDFIFHLAAQPIVSESYKNPMDTIISNSIGTSNLLQIMCDIDWQCSALLVTSDKCYENTEKLSGYKETDQLGGKDIYSASKAAAEIFISSFFRTFLSSKENLTLAVGRAGNVIGGGDWAKDRVVVDCMKAWNKNEAVKIRNPESTRPWQHVLEPLSGYLHLTNLIYESREFNGEAFNFGPNPKDVMSVKSLIEKLSKKFKIENPYEIAKSSNFPESSLLQLDISKARKFLGWQPALHTKEMIESVSDWYFNFFNGNEDLLDFSSKQIEMYESKASKRKLSWTKH